MTRRCAPILILLLAWVLLMLVPARGEKAALPNTPEETIIQYIQALREGSPEGVRAVSHPSSAFYLPGPVNVIRYKIYDRSVWGGP